MTVLSREERIEKAIQRWHEAPPGKCDEPLAEYLGWTWEEYARWVETCNPPPERPDAL